ncbi:MAG: phage SPO1 DNA polymerase-related protein [Gammaproteobacteria bacterium]|nr:phage SPO1 DNA polymerase-related protein [Gammaproteobacteria bacterium]
MIMGGQLTRDQQHYLQLMGITVWLDRNRLVAVPIPETTPVSAQSTVPAPQPDWEILQRQVAACTRCDLHRTRTQTVFGIGNRNADWLIIGEAPGAEEDRQGEPFVGRAGKLLNAMLAAIGLEREQVYIANILKCRPSDNRDPRPPEVSACEGYLQQQIAMIRPKIILALGRIAAQNLLKIEVPIGRMRGQRYTYGAANTPVVVTYHPAYLLRSPREKRKSWQDLQLAMKIYQETR